MACGDGGDCWKLSSYVLSGTGNLSGGHSSLAGLMYLDRLSSCYGTNISDYEVCCHVKCRMQLSIGCGGHQTQRGSMQTAGSTSSKRASPDEDSAAEAPARRRSSRQVVAAAAATASIDLPAHLWRCHKHPRPRSMHKCFLWLSVAGIGSDSAIQLPAGL